MADTSIHNNWCVLNQGQKSPLNKLWTERIKQYRDQTWFFMQWHSPGPVGGVENRGRRATVFNTSQGTWRMLLHWKTMLDRYDCIKLENICYILRYFLHYFVSPFHRRLRNAISTDYARNRVRQCRSRNGSKFVAPVRSYWTLHSRALTVRELPCLYTAFHLLITCDYVFYAIICEDTQPQLQSTALPRLQRK